MLRLSSSAAAIALSLTLIACGGEAPKGSAENSSVAASAADVSLDEQLVALLDQQWEDRVALSPEYQTYLGRKTNYDQWNNRSEEAANAYRALIESQLAAVKTGFDRSALSETGKLNYDLTIYSLENDLFLDEFRTQRFGLSQFRGIHSNIPVFLANYHRIDTLDDANAYVARVEKVDSVLDQAASQMERQLAAGYPLPAFSYPLIVESAENLRIGAPLDGEGELAVYTDFKKKLAELDASDEEKATLEADLIAALKGPYAAGYADFSQRMATLSKSDIIDGDYGVGVRENGAPFYNALLSNFTTTDLTADEVHQLGLDEVARIHDEMRSIMGVVGFEGSLQEFFAFMRTDEQFYYPNTDEGREAYLQLARDYIEGFNPILDEIFITKPKAPVEVRRVEPFRERAAGKAFYNQPAADGSRPGVFYANLYRMEDMPIYQLEALVYHEANPGHHMQRSIQIEMQGLPKFRQYGGYTAFTEGWGLYSELLPKEYGFYEDPYSDFGRLAMELWRAARLVVDTGLHAKGWEMQEAIAYLQENTPNPKGDTIKAIERYIVYPGQATAYKIGMLKIVDLREKARAELGDKFSIAKFHDLVLTGGPLPLSILEQRVDAFIEEERG